MVEEGPERRQGWFVRSHKRATRALGWAEKIWSERRRVATFAAMGLTAAVGYHVVFGKNGLTAYEAKRSETITLERQLKDLSRENECLRGHVERLQQDPNAIEHEAREQLHYTRPGEVIITLPPDGKTHLTKPVVSSGLE